MAAFTLYSYFRSSASFRARCALHYKHIPFDYKPVHLLNNGGEQFSESYTELNPSQTVPTLVHDGHVIGQSVAIIEYLDEVRPERPLFPRDLVQRAHIRQICEIVNSGMQPLANLAVLKELVVQAGFDQAKKDKWAALWIHKGFDALEALLEKSADQYAFGDSVTAADCFIVPQVFTAKRFHVDVSQYPIVDRIAKACLELPEFVAATPDKQPDFQP